MSLSTVGHRSFVQVLVALLAGACAPHAVNAPPTAAAATTAPAAPENTLRGRIVEVLDAKPYTYLRIAAPGGEKWAAVPAFDARVGADVVVSDVMRMVNFESKASGRKFEVVYFGRVGPRAPNAERPAAPPETAAVEGVAPATGPDARTVAQIWAQRAALAGAAVDVRGKVVKASAGIMKGNWYHLRDGTGSASERNNDLTVITPAAAERVPVGEVVTFRGTVAVEKDYGAGYAYPVIVLDATIVR